jgi:tRNA A58 N-methylase Trm61
MAVTKGPVRLATATSDVPYVLGDTGAEHARLIRQASRLVGPTGEVVGVERDVSTMAKARDVAEAGLHSMSFIESDVGHVMSSEPFDAVWFAKTHTP